MEKMIFRVTMVMIAGVALASSMAQAATYQFTASPQLLASQNAAAGEVLAIQSSYNTNTQELSWFATFGEVPNSPGTKTTGFTLAISPGANPKGEDGELALLYFDNSSGSPVLTGYEYNSQNDFTSYKDGSKLAGTQDPARIYTTLNDITQSLIDISVIDHGNGTQTMGFRLDASVLNSRSPLYPGSEPWTGVAYGEEIGIWFHPFTGLSTSYNQEGFLKKWNFGKQGWIDASNLTTVPEPASLALLGLGAIATMRRTRKAAR